jgi:hypothetical protein
MGGGHEHRHEVAAVRRARERIRPDAEPPAAVHPAVVRPELLGLDELDPALLHALRLPVVISCPDRAL